MRHRIHYESDNASFPADAYTVNRYKGIAWRVLGWETQPDEDTEWTGIQPRTGLVVCCMVGDDRLHVFDKDDLAPLAEDDYCPSCGQIGCCHG